jgi:hypothetical protein
VEESGRQWKWGCKVWKRDGSLTSISCRNRAVCMRISSSGQRDWLADASATAHAGAAPFCRSPSLGAAASESNRKMARRRTWHWHGHGRCGGVLASSTPISCTRSAVGMGTTTLPMSMDEGCQCLLRPLLWSTSQWKLLLLSSSSSLFSVVHDNMKAMMMMMGSVECHMIVTPKSPPVPTCAEKKGRNAETVQLFPGPAKPHRQIPTLHLCFCSPTHHSCKSLLL